MPPVEPKSNYERVVDALTKCNFITMEGVQLSNVNKNGKSIMLCFQDIGGDEFSSTFDDTTQLHILGNEVLFVDKDGVEVELKFFNQSKHFL